MIIIIASYQTYSTVSTSQNSDPKSVAKACQNAFNKLTEIVDEAYLSDVEVVIDIFEGNQL